MLDRDTATLASLATRAFVEQRREPLFLAVAGMLGDTAMASDVSVAWGELAFGPPPPPKIQGAWARAFALWVERFGTDAPWIGDHVRASPRILGLDLAPDLVRRLHAAGPTAAGWRRLASTAGGLHDLAPWSQELFGDALEEALIALQRAIGETSDWPRVRRRLRCWRAELAG